MCPLFVGNTTITGCNDDYDSSQYQRGSKGEPPSALSEIYSRDFNVSKAKYFEALSEFYEYTVVNEFGNIEFHECFNKALRIKVNKDEYPCIAVTAMKGVPTKAYVSFSVLDRNFYNRQKDQDYIKYKIEVYSLNKHIKLDHTFSVEFEEKLINLGKQVLSKI